MRRAALLLILAGCSAPSPYTSHYNRGLDAYDQGDLATAISEFTLAVEDEPANYRAWFNLGVAYHDQGALEPAERAYLKVLEIQPDNARAHINLAVIYEKRGDPGTALTHLQLATNAEPDRAFPITAMGKYWEGRGHSQRAEEFYRQAVAKESTHVESNYYLGKLLIETGRVDEGMTYLEAALDSDPNDVPSLKTASRGYALRGDRVNAILSLQRAEMRARNNIEPVLYLQLAELLEAEERFEEAATYVWKARDRGAPAELYEPIQKRLYERLLQQP